MKEARFIADGVGGVAQNPRFDQCALDLAGGAELGLEAERIRTAKIAVRDSRALHRAQVRIDAGLLLEAAPADRLAAEEAALTDLPTEEFEIVAATSDDPEKMRRIRAQRQEKRRPATRKEQIEEDERWQRRLEEARQRLDGRLSPSTVRGRRSAGRS